MSLLGDETNNRVLVLFTNLQNSLCIISCRQCTLYETFSREGGSKKGRKEWISRHAGEVNEWVPELISATNNTATPNEGNE